LALFFLFIALPISRPPDLLVKKSGAREDAAGGRRPTTLPIAGVGHERDASCRYDGRPWKPERVA